MKKVKALTKYELINFKKSKLFWTILILYIIGIVLSVYPYFHFEKSFVSFIMNSWIPMNVIMVPCLLVAINVGKSENEIFNYLDISNKEKILSKLMPLGIISLAILIINIVIATVFAIISNISFQNYIYESAGYILNTILFLIVSMIIGLFVGKKIVKKTGEVVGVIISIGVFLLLTNFFRFFNVVIPIINIRQMSNSFDPISYDRTYLYHNVFWILVSYILFQITFWPKRSKKIISGIKVITIITSIICCIFLGQKIYSLKPVLYDSGKGIISETPERKMEIRETFKSEEEKKYYAYKYDMNIKTDNEFYNDCTINIKILEDKVDSIELGFYKKFNISQLKIDHKAMDFTKGKNSVKIQLPKTFNRGEEIVLNIKYSGYINISWYQNQQLLFVRNNGLCLAGPFEWYPKQNDGREKEYKVSIISEGKNKIYSNLGQIEQSESIHLNGKDREIILVKGNLKVQEYKGYKIIGNEELINDKEKLDFVIRARGKLKNTKTIIQVPLEYYIDEFYDNAIIVKGL